MNIPDSVYEAATAARPGIIIESAMRAIVDAAIAEYDKLRTVSALELDRDHATRNVLQACAERDRVTAKLREVEGQRDYLGRLNENQRATVRKAEDRITELERNIESHETLHCTARADLAAAQKLVDDLRDSLAHMGDRVSKAESALTRAGYTRCDVEAGWRPPIGKKPLSMSVQRYDIGVAGMHMDDDGLWIAYEDVQAWESLPKHTPAPPPPQVTSPRGAALEVLEGSILNGTTQAIAIADAIAAAIEASKP